MRARYAASAAAGRVLGHGYLPADALAGGPLAGYAITIDLAPAPFTPDAHLRPDPPTHQAHSSGHEGAARSHRDASSPSLAGNANLPIGDSRGAIQENGVPGTCRDVSHMLNRPSFAEDAADRMALPGGPAGARIHFDSVDSALEAAVLRHVAQLATAPVIVDRPGGVVHSDRELRIVLPNSGDAAADEAAAVAVEFGVLRGLLDLTAPAGQRRGAAGGKLKDRGDSVDNGCDGADGAARLARGWKRWWPFGVVLILAGLGFLRASGAAVARRGAKGAAEHYTLRPRLVEARLLLGVTKGHRVPFRAAELEKPAPLEASVLPVTKGHRLKSVLLEADPAQGQFATGQGLRITDGNNFLVVDPCKGQLKLFASINQTGNTQLVAGTAAKKIYVCSIHVVAAAAANVAVVEGTGSVCGTGTAGVSGFGGATAATGWNFAANGGIALGNGDSSLGAEGTSGDNLCVFNSGSGQVSGGISYVVQ